MGWVEVRVMDLDRQKREVADWFLVRRKAVELQHMPPRNYVVRFLRVVVGDEMWVDGLHGGR